MRRLVCEIVKMEDFLQCVVYRHLLQTLDFKTAAQLAFAFGANEGKYCIKENEITHLKEGDVFILTMHDPLKMPYAKPFTNEWVIVDKIDKERITLSNIDCCFSAACPHGFIKTRPSLQINKSMGIRSLCVELEKQVFSKQYPLKICKRDNKETELNLYWVDLDILGDPDCYIQIPAFDYNTEKAYNTKIP